MGKSYEDEWWAVDLPAEWSGQRDGDTALIAAEDGCGMLQIKAFRSDGRDLDDDDLKSLAAHHIEQKAQLHRVRYGLFSGFYVYFQAEQEIWYEWWLRAGPLALHATYHCGVEDRSREEASVARILGSLRALER
jgi:hypothetical protein